MNNASISKYFTEKSYLNAVNDYLGQNSIGYGFSAQKNERDCLCFIDNKQRIFAMVNQNTGEIQLAPYTNKKTLVGIEGILNHEVSD